MNGKPRESLVRVFGRPPHVSVVFSPSPLDVGKSTEVNSLVSPTFKLFVNRLQAPVSLYM